MIQILLAAYNGEIYIAQQLDSLLVSVERQQQQNTELQRLISSGDEMAYIERIAHDKLGFAAPGERVFIDITGK